MENLVNRNILITGRYGAFTGSYLFKRLREDNRVGIQPEVRKYKDVFDALTRHEIEYVFHLAARTTVEACYYNPIGALETNIMGTVNVLEAVRNYRKIKGVLIASSDKAYGKKNDKYTEDCPLRGDHPYDVSKSSADLITQMYYKTYGLPVVITRAANTYGLDHHYNRIIPGIIKAIIRSETLKLRSDGKARRDYLFVNDVVDADIALMENIDKVKGEAFNIPGKENYSVIELIKKIERILKVDVKYEILNEAKNEIPFQSLCGKKIKKAIGWEPTWNMEETIPGLFKEYRKALK